ncbi:MAG: FIST N-terminal domain-containing protein, partial [Nanoarchaeota archaeon]
MAIKAGVGISDNSDGISAIQEAIKKSIKDIGQPKFSIILMSINYENDLKDILKEAKKLLPKTQIVGGTGAAILASEGVYVRGIGVLSVSGDLEVGIGVGKNSRTKSELAGQVSMTCAIKNLGKTKYKNKFAIVFVSGMKFPNIPGMKTMMKMGISKNLFPMLSNFMAKAGTGPA